MDNIEDTVINDIMADEPLESDIEPLEYINCKLANTNIDWTKKLCIVDLSYLTYVRFFAIRIWYNNTYPDANITQESHDWCKDKIFMAKYEQLFLKKLKELCKLKDIPINNIIFALDCRHITNWRVINCKNYKSTRKESHVKNNFHNFDIFQIVKNKIIPEQLQNTTGNLMLMHNNLEADDIVNLLIKYIQRSKPNYTEQIIIIANDKDYIQICSNQVELIDLFGKSISNVALLDISAKDYLIKKILIGDTSDNIPPCYISSDILIKADIRSFKPYLKATPNIVNKLMTIPTVRNILEQLLDKSRIKHADPSITYSDAELNITKDNQFDYNSLHMDFENIPQIYKAEATAIIEACLI